MRKLLLSAAVLALTACGQQQSADNQSVDAGEITTTTSALTLGPDGVPKFKAGAWEVTEQSEGETKEVRRECIGEPQEAQLRQMITQEFAKTCKVERSSGSERIYLKAACPQGGLNIETEIDITGSDTQFDMKMGTFVTKADGTRDGAVNISTGRWVGACPAGVQPGQEIGGESEEG